MVIEIATLFIKPESEAEFAGGFGAAVDLLTRAAGCHGVRWGKRVEPELAYVLEVEWGELQDHFNYRETDDFKEFGTYFRQHLSKAPKVMHFEPRG